MENLKKTLAKGKTSLNCGGKLLDLSQPIVMGIINVTPDSFYDGGITFQPKDTLDQAEKMLKEGALILDIGGQSSRPGADSLSSEEELKRVIPAIEAITKRFPEAILSIDTFHSSVARRSILAGAKIINDISAGEMDENMIPVAAELNAPYFLMHKKGSSKTMQENPEYSNVVEEVFHYLLNKVKECKEAGITDIVIDPGFGFGKTQEHNFSLLKDLKVLELINCPILTGLSRKSMIYKCLNSSPKEALNGTTALNMLALNNGAKILRVHDVKEAQECITLFNLYNKA
jgi:dihydropteroate synthase